MTIIDFSLFAKIKPAELLNQVRLGMGTRLELAIDYLFCFWRDVLLGLAEDQVQTQSSQYSASGGEDE